MSANKNAIHIGIVGGSYEGAALCYKTICNEGADFLGEHSHPEISLHTYPLKQYLEFIYKNDWNGVADLMISSAKKLISIGAEILICPDNTNHQPFPVIKKEITAPWLHIAEEVLSVAGANNFRNVGILGTKYLVEGPVYREKCMEHGFGYTIPEEDQRIRINEIIFKELVNGIFNESSKKYLSDVINDLKLKGCDAVILGCTEIPLIIFPEDSSLPVLDSTRILARAALKKSIVH